MALFVRMQFEKDEDEAGIHMSSLGRALVIWAAMNSEQHEPTISMAAQAFNTTPAVIREAIDEAMWIEYAGPDDDPTKQVIELDGE